MIEAIDKEYTGNKICEGYKMGKKLVKKRWENGEKLKKNCGKFKTQKYTSLSRTSRVRICSS
jgi:hypothetical protein